MEDITYHRYGEVLKNTDFAKDRKEAYIPYSEDMSCLSKPITVGSKTVANRIQYQPMEAQDSLLDGTPSERTFERYTRLARGGAGLLWFEAVSISKEGKSNAHQLCITDENLHVFKRLVSAMKNACLESCGFEPVIIMQMNHSGRYSKPTGVPEPITAYYNPDIESAPKTVADDAYLESLTEEFIHTALLAEKAGFDGIDVKACHGYLMSELLSAYNRDGRYGGSFENRTRLFTDVLKGVNERCSPDFIRAARINVYDGYLDSHSFCESENRDGSFELTEAHALVDIFEKHGGQLLDVTMGSPYRNPDVSRPYRKGIDTPKTNAIHALSRLWAGASEIRKKHKVVIVNTGISLLGSLSNFAAAGAVEEGMTDLVGFGRMSFAYPDLASDILKKGALDPKRSCVCCGGCSYLKKNLCESGCIIRDDYYKKIFRDFQAKKEIEK